jgi:hypothetical protein
MASAWNYDLQELQTAGVDVGDITSKRAPHLQAYDRSLAKQLDAQHALNVPPPTQAPAPLGLQAVADAGPAAVGAAPVGRATGEHQGAGTAEGQTIGHSRQVDRLCLHYQPFMIMND